MKIPESLKPKLILQSAGETIKRFPLVLLACLLAGSLVEYNERSGNTITPLLLKTLLTAFLLIPTFISIRLLQERGEKTRPWLLLLIPAGFFILTKDTDLLSAKFQFAQLFVATHVFASIAPFLTGRRDGEFWEFNKTLFLRFILSSIYSGVLLTGLYVCMAALKGLFYLDITGKDFFTVFVICAFIFHPTHFLAGVPRDLDRLPEYPRPLQIFCQNLFIPLITILGTILIVYSVTIAATMNWPRGLVSILISTFSSLGLLSVLLVDPLVRNRTSWLPKYSRYFYVVMTILSVVMMAAAWRRISDYAITEERYFVILIALWLLLIGVLFVTRPGRSIKIIPVSLFVVSLLSAYGPWSAHSVSLRSQKNRLEKILLKHKLLVSGKLDSSGGGLKEDSESARSIISYIERHHGMKELSHWMKSNDHSVNRFFEEAGISYRSYDYDNYWSIYPVSQFPVVDIAGFSKLQNFNIASEGQWNDRLTLRQRELIVQVHGLSDSIPIEKFIGASAFSRFNTSVQKDLIFEGGSGDKKWKIVVEHASGYLGSSESNRRIQSVSGILFY